MAVTTASPPVYLRSIDTQSLLAPKPRFCRLFSSKGTPKILAMAPKTKKPNGVISSGSLPPPTSEQVIGVFEEILKVNKYDDDWRKQWYGAGIFYEGSEDVNFDVFKKLEKRKVLSNVEKAGLLSKAEELGFTLSSIEKLGVFSKAEELGLLSLLEKTASVSPSTLASASLPILVAAILAVVVIPNDPSGLVAVKAVVAGGLGAGAVGLLVGSVVLGGLQEAD